MARTITAEDLRCSRGLAENTSRSASPRSILRQAILRDALKVSDEPFTLSSGKKSHHYYDLKTVLMDATCLAIIGEVVWEMAREQSVDAIGGLESGAIPIAVSVLRESHAAGSSLRAFFVRKKPKKHGTQKWIEGNLRSGDKVMIVDDVVTTGNSLITAVERTQEIGCHILSVICVVDRLEGAKEKLDSLGVPFVPLFRHSDFEGMLSVRR